MQSNEYIIRDYQPVDYHKLMRLWNVTGLNTPGRGDNEIIIERTISVGGKLLVMLDERKDKIVGSSWLTSDGRRLYLHHFGILPEFQGRGLSKSLLSKSLAYAKEIGQQIKLEVHQNNTIAKNLYKKASFKYLGDYEVYIIRDISLI
ncbi:MAG: GNAT family N-acetyltransferase [Bacteroidota bacterium]